MYVSDGTVLSFVGKIRQRFIYLGGNAYSFKSDDQEMSIFSLNNDLKAIRERALHIFGERTFQTDKAHSANVLRLEGAPSWRNFHRNQ